MSIYKKKKVVHKSIILKVWVVGKNIYILKGWLVILGYRVIYTYVPVFAVILRQPCCFLYEQKNHPLFTHLIQRKIFIPFMFSKDTVFAFYFILQNYIQNIQKFSYSYRFCFIAVFRKVFTLYIRYMPYIRLGKKTRVMARLRLFIYI